MKVLVPIIKSLFKKKVNDMQNLKKMLLGGKDSNKNAQELDKKLKVFVRRHLQMLVPVTQEEGEEEASQEGWHKQKEEESQHGRGFIC